VRGVMDLHGGDAGTDRRGPSSRRGGVGCGAMAGTMSQRQARLGSLGPMQRVRGVKRPSGSAANQKQCKSKSAIRLHPGQNPLNDGMLSMPIGHPADCMTSRLWLFLDCDSQLRGVSLRGIHYCCALPEPWQSLLILIQRRNGAGGLATKRLLTRSMLIWTIHQAIPDLKR
jgi:hypothetical protein